MQPKKFVHGYYFDEEPSSNRVTELDELNTDKPYWLHFDYELEATDIWLNEKSGLNQVVIDALLHDETRPRASVFHDGILISLRGVNLAANSNPEDMVSIRLWFGKDRVISTRHRTLLSVRDIAADFDAGEGPATPAQFVSILTGRLIIRMAETIEEIEDKVSEIEESILMSSNYGLRNELSDCRRQIISLRRYLSPQREAMQQLLSEKVTLFSTDERIQLREATDHLIRFIEDLDSIKDRATVSQEELSNRLAEQMNGRMYVLSIVAAIFLPLGFFTGLLGVNVGGIPGSDNPYAFGLFSFMLVVVVSLQVWVFKKNKWF
ncbi:zinc transporter ZntB [Psychrosphaera saromensis]|uniref:Zinc transporter ZntB n=1 Tax=Psychrosphaera saromensis TaxID=716813 RepID=A0A2S7UY72_9GAMM|nr:zinc transporter ZntB [Psychrosphaera saromensis]PQJ54946.1 zinc transporter ZntB [Psychrosphaera saromensis]GHB55916.1 zinc transporter ZntB [Psychrosphaera saromensis]GLQ13804.1 zinc transporter ZntB [Psychrosphaera saromensis]